ncbi:MAG: hypothetical protein CSB15_00720 [Clostridiales bacterium]|nr:MAG: hypothetical protein CSB15_00720 [Clostridiales bacterium]
MDCTIIRNEIVSKKRVLKQRNSEFHSTLKQRNEYEEKLEELIRFKNGDFINSYNSYSIVMQNKQNIINGMGQVIQYCNVAEDYRRVQNKTIGNINEVLDRKYENMLAKIDREIRNLKKKINALTSEISVLKRKINNLNTELSKLQYKLEKAQAELDKDLEEIDKMI